MPEALVSLGRAVIREAYQHTWSAELQRECGWDDDGDVMDEFTCVYSALGTIHLASSRTNAPSLRAWRMIVDEDACLECEHTAARTVLPVV